MTEEVRELVETPRRRNCERESKHVKWFMLGQVSWDNIFWEYNDGGSKRACQNTPKKELRKKVEIC